MITTQTVNQKIQADFNSVCKTVSTFSIVDVYVLHSARKRQREGVKNDRLKMGQDRVLITNVRPKDADVYCN